MKTLKQICEEQMNIQNELNILFVYWVNETDERVKKLFFLDILENCINLKYCNWLIDTNNYIK